MPSQETLTIGKPRNGVIPVVVKASSVQIPLVRVSTLGIATTCIKGVAAKTCGGTFLLTDGKTVSPDCTARYSDGDSVCTSAGLPPCAFIHGDGNTAHGSIGCPDGLDNIDLSEAQDSGGSSGACAPPNLCEPAITLSGHGAPGSSQFIQSLGISANEYANDQIYCTGDEPNGGTFAGAMSAPAVTGTASAVVRNANGADGVDLGPVSTVGAPFSCSALANGSAVGAGLVQTFTFVHLDTVGDVAVTEQLFTSASPPPTPTPGPCIGDCNGSGEVGINELIVMVNIALDSTPISACRNGDADHSNGISITEIIVAVNNALDGCAGD